MHEMISPVSIETDSLLFDKLLDPLEPTLKSLDLSAASTTARKLGFRLFVRLLLYRLFSGTVSLRDLVQDLRMRPVCRRLGFPRLGLATFHDAFSRYSETMFAELFKALVKQSAALVEIGEAAAFGALAAVDSSYFAVRRINWLAREQLRGARLHLALSVTKLVPACVVASFDRSPSIAERAVLRTMLEAGVTYILDRGYIELKLYKEIIERGAAFVIRAKESLRHRVLAEIEVECDGLSRIYEEVRDQVVKLAMGAGGRYDETVFRLVQARIGGKRYLILTSRFDLTTAEVLRLYAWRWQVELIFRAFKHTLGGRHLINYSRSGIEMQFSLLVTAALLWALWQQKITRELEIKLPEQSNRRARTITGKLSAALQVGWRLRKRTLRLLNNCLGEPLSIYIKELMEQRV